MNPLYLDLVDELKITEHVTTGYMMGHPGMKANGYFFAFHFKEENAMLFKLYGRDHAQALALPGSRIFAPGGSPMKEWVVVPTAHQEQWRDFTFAALEYIRSLPTKPPKKKKA